MGALTYLFCFSFILGISVSKHYVSLNIPLPSHPLLRMEPCKIFVVSSIIMGTKLSHMYVTFDLIKLIFLLFMWVLVLSSNFACVRYVNFKSNLSIFTRFDETKCLLSHRFLKWVCLFTFFSLFEPFMLFIMLDKIKFCYPSIKILMDIKKRSYYTIHTLCFLTFKSIIRMSAFFAFMFLSIPSSTLWYFQLILSLSNDISENPGPQCTNNTWGDYPISLSVTGILIR